jgi:hypothetical protein
LHLTDSIVLEHFQAGYSDGTLPGLLPKAGELVESLRTNGMLNSEGQETLLGCLVVPVVDSSGTVKGFCGIKPSTNSEPVEIVVPAKCQGVIRAALARDSLSGWPGSRTWWTGISA